jgi:hypothetical protein
LKALEKQLAEEKVRFSELEKEQEDLLVCMGKIHKSYKREEELTYFLGEQDLDVKKYKKRLRDVGEAVTDSEDEEEE